MLPLQKLSTDSLFSQFHVCKLSKVNIGASVVMLEGSINLNHRSHTLKYKDSFNILLFNVREDQCEMLSESLSSVTAAEMSLPDDQRCWQDIFHLWRPWMLYPFPHQRCELGDNKLKRHAEILGRIAKIKKHQQMRKTFPESAGWPSLEGWPNVAPYECWLWVSIVTPAGPRPVSTCCLRQFSWVVRNKPRLCLTGAILKRVIITSVIGVLTGSCSSWTAVHHGKAWRTAGPWWAGHSTC